MHLAWRIAPKKSLTRRFANVQKAFSLTERAIHQQESTHNQLWIARHAMDLDGLVLKGWIFTNPSINGQ